jgi:hypothetical protein
MSSSPDWLHELGHAPNQWQQIYDPAIPMMKEIQDQFPSVPMVSSGNVGPCYDGCVLGRTMTMEELPRLSCTTSTILSNSGSEHGHCCHFELH